MDSITGERIQQACDVYCGFPEDFRFNPVILATSAKHCNLQTLHAPWDNPPVVFCYGHRLKDFSQKLHLLQNPCVLVSHNSDETILDTAAHRALLECPRICVWYAQNICMRHEKLRFLPIGIANAMWHHGALSTLAAAQAVVAHHDHVRDHDVYFYFSIATNREKRAPCKATLERAGFVFGRPQEFGDYLRKLGRHRYAICPDGHGADSHRIWECYALGVIPIVLRSTFTELLAAQYVALVVDDWSEVNVGALRAAHAGYAEKLAALHAEGRLSISQYTDAFKEAAAAHFRK